MLCSVYSITSYYLDFGAPFTTPPRVWIEWFFVAGVLSIFRRRLIFYATKVDIRGGCVSWDRNYTFKVSYAIMLGFIYFLVFLYYNQNYLGNK